MSKCITIEGAESDLRFVIEKVTFEAAQDMIRGVEPLKGRSPI